MKVAVYPGSFDPVTFGHIDIIKRASSMFDKLIVAVLVNRKKTPMFNYEERVELIENSLEGLDNVEVVHFEGLLVDYLKKNNYKILVKGLRAISDFESEFQMASVNRQLDDDIDTVFIMTKVEYMYLSSSIVKEVYSFDGDISKFVPEKVNDKMKKMRRESDE